MTRRFWLVLLLLLLATPALAAAAVKVRGADHADFSRLVFELPAALAYTASASGGRALVDIAGDVAIESGVIERIGLKRLADVTVTAGKGHTRVSWDIAAGATLKHYVDGRTLVVDTRDGAPSAVQPSAGKADRSGGDGFLDQQLSGLKAAAADKADAARRAAAVAAPKPPASRSAVVTALEAADALRQANAPLAAEVRATTDGAQIVYRFASRLPAAAVQRGNHLLIGWPGQHVIGHPPLEAASGDRVRSARRSLVGGNTLLNLELRAGSFAGLRRNDTDWILTIKDSEILPRETTPIEQQKSDVGGARLFAALPEPGQPIEALDPADGRRLLLVPTTAASRGVVEPQTHAGGMLLASASGLALKPATARVHLIRYANGVAILGLDAPGGDALRSGARGFRNDAGALLPNRLVDLDAWALKNPNEFSKTKGALNYALAMAGEADRQARRWDLARLYLGARLAPDAIGVLDVMAATDPDLLNTPAFRAARGVAHYLNHDAAGALEDLDRPLLDGEPDLWLWRAAALELAGRPQDALRAYAAGEDVLTRFDPALRADFLLAATRADFKAGGATVARTALDALPSAGLSPEQQTEAAYWRGRLAALDGRKPEAAANYALAQKIGGRRYAAYALLAQVEDDLARRAIQPPAAIDRLERLRFAWRGDDFELDLLEKLAELYFGNNQTREGLSLLKQAVTYFPLTDRTRAIAQRMDQVFRSLFLDGKADALPPARAVALYYDFRDLTPLGADGDAMIRRLVERLVSVNLLDRAAGLLDHQVRFRLEGVAQAQVAGRLAMIHILNGKPDEALLVLRATRQEALPADVRAERNRIEARALVMLGKGDEAEATIEGDDSPVARQLRADIYWQAKDWTRLAPAIDKVLASAGEWGPDQQGQVLRLAVARTLLGDEAGLAALRAGYRARMAGGPYAAAFDVITAPNSTPDAIGNLAETLKAVDSIDGVVKNYRAAFAAPRSVAPPRTG